MAVAITRTEIGALLAVAQDHAFAQPVGSQLRATVLGQHLAVAAGADSAEQATTWWTSALRFLGCTGHAFDMAVVFGDEIEMRAQAMQFDFANPFDMMRLMVTHAGPGTAGVNRMRSVLSVLAGGKKATAIPRPMRIAQLSQELEVLARIEGIDRALTIIHKRRGKAYEPELTDLALAHGAAWWDAVEPLDPWDAALGVAPFSQPLDDGAMRESLLVLADFSDLKSPWLGGHSRAVAALAADASGRTAELAALVHDLGRVAVPNLVWDKPASLTRDERDRVEMHALVTDQLLRRVPFTQSLADVASGAHERVDGSGYHRRLAAAHLDDAQRVLAAADCYQALVSDRPHRAALARDDAATELRTMSAAGRLDGEAVERVLVAAGHRRGARAPLPAGLTAREAEVLRLLALGMTTRQVADELVISPKTADHHVQHIYTKIGVSTRGAAALFAIEHGILVSAG